MIEINGYKLPNKAKYTRAIEGSVNREGDFVGGVGEDADDNLKLAAYDRLGGLILNSKGEQIKTGCFCNLKESRKKSREARRPVVVMNEEPKIILQFVVPVINDKGNMARKIVEVPEGKNVPMEVKVAKMAGEQIQAKERKLKK